MNERRMNPRLFTLLMFIISSLLICCVILLILDSYTVKVVDNKNNDQISYVYDNIKMYRAVRSETEIENLETVPHSDELESFGGYYYYNEVKQNRNKSSILTLDTFIPGDKIEFDLVITNKAKKDLSYVVKFTNELSEFDNLFDYFEIEADYKLKVDDDYIWNLWDYNKLNKVKTLHYSISIPITSNAYEGQFKLKIEVLTRAI